MIATRFRAGQGTELRCDTDAGGEIEFNNVCCDARRQGYCAPFGG
jgi:hypothetical protein